MSERSAKAPVPEAFPSIEPAVMRKLGEFVDRTFKEEPGVRIRNVDLVVEVGIAYNDLRSLVDDVTDHNKNNDLRTPKRILKDFHRVFKRWRSFRAAAFNRLDFGLAKRQIQSVGTPAGNHSNP